MDTEQTEQQQAVEAPAPAPSRDAGIDELLAQYDAETKQPESAPDTQPEGTVDGGELDRLLADLGPDPRIAELEGKLGEASGQLDQFRQAEYERAEQKAYDTFVDAIKQQIPDNGLPDGWVSDKLMAMAARDKNLLAAWEYRNADRAAIDLELRKVEAAYDQMQRTGGDPQKLAQLRD